MVDKFIVVGFVLLTIKKKTKKKILYLRCIKNYFSPGFFPRMLQRYIEGSRIKKEKKLNLLLISYNVTYRPIQCYPDTLRLQQVGIHQKSYPNDVLEPHDPQSRFLVTFPLPLQQFRQKFFVQQL